MWNYIILTVVTALANYVLAPRIKNEPPPEPEAPDVPFHEEGKEIPVIFGTVEVSPFIGWYDGFNVRKIFSDTVEGKK